MTRIFFAAAAASLSFAAAALANDREFTHDGVTYTYTAARQHDARVIEGVSSLNGRFKLVVREGWVRGHVGGVPVSFRAPRGDAPVVIAAR